MTRPRSQREVGDLHWRMDRDRAERMVCRWPGCGAQIGQHCRNPRTGDVIKAPAHPPRIADALRMEERAG